MRNDEIPKKWKHGIAAHTKTMSTDGKKLYSYNLMIGYTEKDGSKTSIEYCSRNNHFYSVTTSKHCSYAARYSDKDIQPEDIPKDMKE